MEHTTNEIALIQEVAKEATEAQLRELAQLQLAVSCGGLGDALAM